jgi:hypothetical protein
MEVLEVERAKKTIEKPMETRQRLSDKINDAHFQACKVGRVDVAEVLLRALEVEITAFGGLRQENRDNTEMLESAFAALEEAKSKA